MVGLPQVCSHRLKHPVEVLHLGVKVLCGSERRAENRTERRIASRADSRTA